MTNGALHAVRESITIRNHVVSMILCIIILVFTTLEFIVKLS